MNKRERAQPGQHKVTHGRESAGYPQPGGARCQTELDDEVPRCGGKVTDDDVRAEVPNGAHPRNDFGEWVVRSDEEDLHPARREAEVGSTVHDGMRDLQVGEHVGGGQDGVAVVDFVIHEKDALGDSAG